LDGDILRYSIDMREEYVALDVGNGFLKKDVQSFTNALAKARESNTNKRAFSNKR